MDLTHQFPVVDKHSARARQAGTAKRKAPDGRRVDPGPSSEGKKWDSAPQSDKWLAAGQLETADAKIPYRIDGWLAERGTSVWFGAGSTGKTQLMLWMAAMIASLPEDRPEQIWLGGRIKGTGHVLILTAEDSREQIVGRLREVVEHSMGQDSEASRRTCERLHVMPFLSMSEQEFAHPNPSLFALDEDRIWAPSDVMREIKRYIAEWNERHPEIEDRIIGVVMDSATSMAGFDSMDAQAATNFFFYLGRLCERLEIFWAVLGHTPKVVAYPKKNIRDSAASRLRGVAMWTTAPRLTVEMRLFQESGDSGNGNNGKPELRAWLPRGIDKRDILVVSVAKANLKGASQSERFLLRLRRGAFVDVTERPEEVLTSGLLDDLIDRDASITDVTQSDLETTDDAEESSTGRGKRRRSASPKRGRPKRDARDFDPGTSLVHELIQATYPSRNMELIVSANKLAGLLAANHAHDARAALIKSASGGGKRPARLGSINWHLDQLTTTGVLVKRDQRYRLPPGSPDPGSAVTA